MVRPKYDPEKGEFKGLYETIGYLIVGGSPEEVFFNYGYDKEKSKVLSLQKENSTLFFWDHIQSSQEHDWKWRGWQRFFKYSFFPPCHHF